MELWIRSQDKSRLTKVNSVNILEFDGFIAIHGYINSNTHFWLANYKTKERALEVLDEIQEVLCPKILMMKPNSQITLNDGVNIVLPDNCSYERIGDTYVYEMPEK